MKSPGRVTLDPKKILLFSKFNSVFKVTPLDIEEHEDCLYVIIPSESFGKCLGILKKNMETKKAGGKEDKSRIERVFGKKIRLIPFNEDKKKFIGNLIHPIKDYDVIEKDSELVIVVPSMKEVRMLRRNNQEYIKLMENLLSRFFNGNPVIKLKYNKN